MERSILAMTSPLGLGGVGSATKYVTSCFLAAPNPIPFRQTLPADLPSALKNFAFYNAAVVDSGRDFQHHMDGLIRSINNLLKVASPPGHRPRRDPVGLQ